MYRLVTPCLFGLEKTLSFEIKRAGGENITVNDGRAFFDGDERVIAKMNITSSVAERVGIVLGEFKANTFDDIFEGVKNAPIEEFAGRDDAFPVVKGHSVKSKITSIPALQRTVKKALVERMSKKYKIDRFAESGQTFPIHFLLQKDRMLLTLDTTGASLHKRGYRAMSGEAPIRETLAAGIVDIAHLRIGDIVCDPFCGSGTMLIEAALKMQNIAPGLNRSFIAQEWHCFHKEIWQEEISAAIERKKNENITLYGFDNDEKMIELAKENAWKAGVDKYISFEKRDIKEFIYPKEPCKIITNPPYAQRMMSEEEVSEIYRIMGKRLFPLNENSLYIITSREDLPDLLGQKADKDRKLYNGMLKCRLYSYFNKKS